MITCVLWVLLTLLNCSMYKASSVKGATWRSPLKSVNWKSQGIVEPRTCWGTFCPRVSRTSLRARTSPTSSRWAACSPSARIWWRPPKQKVRKIFILSWGRHLLRNRDLLNFAADDLWLRCNYTKHTVRDSVSKGLLCFYVLKKLTCVRVTPIIHSLTHTCIQQNEVLLSLS